ncbi:MAG: DUF4908 domain-containing protein [Rhizomicrobium sp.]
MAAPAYAEMNDRLSQQHFGTISSGDFVAGDSVHFQLARYHGEYLMRVAGDPETYVLYADYGPLGGRVLRYDSGATAIQVAGWGAMTLYTDNKPDGLPAMRTGDAQGIAPPNVSFAQLMGAADDEASHIAYVSGVRISFNADWNAYAGDANWRSLVYDTLENTARGIIRLAANPAARAAFAQRVSAVRLQPSHKPTIQLSGRTLIVTFNPQQAFMGRASSRAIAFAMGKLLQAPVSN